MQIRHAILGAAALVVTALTVPLEAGILHVDANNADIKEGSVGPISGSSSGIWRDLFSYSSSAYADYGVLKLYNNVQAIELDPNYSRYSISNSGDWTDSFVIDSPGLTGTAGKVIVEYLAEGLLSFSGMPNGDTHISTEFRVLLSTSQGTYSDSVNYVLSDTGVVGGTNFLNQVRSQEIPFVFGDTIYITMALSSAVNWVNAGYPGSGATADLGHSAYWEGIANVQTSSGVPVTNFTALSSDGLNYANSFSAVPEPGTLALFAIGGAGALLLRVKRRRI